MESIEATYPNGVRDLADGGTYRTLAGQPTDDSELALVVREENIGWVVTPGDARAIADVVRAARSDRQRLTEMGERARAAAVTKYPLSRAVESYSELLRSTPK